MTSKQFKRWLSQQGCTFEPGKGGHLIVRLGKLWTVLPETGLVNGIKKDLGLK